MACRRVLCGSSVYTQKNWSLSDFGVGTIEIDEHTSVVSNEDSMFNERV